MVQQTRSATDTQLADMFNDGGNATAAEFRTFITNFLDSVAYAALATGLDTGRALMLQDAGGGLMELSQMPIVTMPGNRLLLEGAAGAEGTGFSIGPGVTLTSINSFLASNNAQFPDAQFVFVDQQQRRDGPSPRPRSFTLTEAENELVLQSENGDTLTGTALTPPLSGSELTFVYTATQDSQTNSVMFDTNAEMTGVRLRIRYGTAPNTVIRYWPSEQDWIENTGNTVPNGVQVLDFGNSQLRTFSGVPEFSIPADRVEVTVRADNISLAGDDTATADNPQGTPYLAAMIQRGSFQDLAYFSDVTALQTEITALQNSAFNSGRAYRVFQDGFTIDGTNLAQFEDINNIYAAKNDKPFDAATRPDVNLPTDADISTAGEPYPVTMEFTHLGGSERFTDRNVLRFFFNGVEQQRVFRDQVVIVTKPGVGLPYEFQVSDFDPTVVLLPSGTFVLKPETPVNNIATIATELASATILGGNAFRVQTGGEWSGFDVPNNSVLVALVDSPSLSDSTANNDWLLLENGRVNTDVAMLLSNFVRDGIAYDATRNIRAHPDNVTIFNSMATGAPLTRQVAGNTQGNNRQIRYDNVPLRFADLVGGRLELMFSHTLSRQSGFAPRPVALDLVYGATTFTFDISGVPMDNVPVRLSIPIASEDYSAILNTDVSVRWRYNFNGAFFDGSFTIAAAMNMSTGRLHDPIQQLIETADLALKADIEAQIRSITDGVDAQFQSFAGIEDRISPLVDVTTSSPDIGALFLDSSGADPFPSDLTAFSDVSSANPRYTPATTAIFLALVPGANYVLQDITGNTIIPIDTNRPDVDVGESLTVNQVSYFVYRITGLTAGNAYEVDRTSLHQVVAWANDLQNLQAAVHRIDASLSHALLGLNADVVEVLDALTVDEQTNVVTTPTDFNQQQAGPSNTSQTVFYEPNENAGSGGQKNSRPLSELSGDQAQRKLLYIPDEATFANQASYVVAFDGTTGRDLISYIGGEFLANVLVPAVPASTRNETVYPAPSNRVSGDGIWQTIPTLTFVNNVPVPEADELFFVRDLPNGPRTMTIQYRGHANGNLFGAGTATLAIGGPAEVATTFTISDGSEQAFVEVRYYPNRNGRPEIRVSVTERVNTGLPTINDVQVILSYTESRTVPATPETVRQVAIEAVHDGWQVFAFKPAASGNLAIVGDQLEIDTGYTYATLFGAGLGGHLTIAEQTARFLNFEDFDPIDTTVQALQDHAGLPQLGLFTDTHTEETDLNIPVTIKPSGLNIADLPTSATGLNSGDVWFNGTALQFVP